MNSNKTITASLDEIVEAVMAAIFKPAKNQMGREFQLLQKHNIRTALEGLGKDEKDRWISVEERLPDEGVIVIGYFPNRNESGEEVSTAFYDGNNVRSDFPNSTSYAFVATHWMPLPPAPTPTEKGGEG